MKSAILLFLILYSCGVNNTDKTEIEGNWVIESNTPYSSIETLDAQKDGKGSFITLFGVDAWGNSNGKYFNLKKNNTVETNIIDQDLVKKIDLQYEVTNDSTTIFSCIFPNDTSRNKIPVYYKINNEEMTWYLDDFLKIKLKKD